MRIGSDDIKVGDRVTASAYGEFKVTGKKGDDFILSGPGGKRTLNRKFIDTVFRKGRRLPVNVGYSSGQVPSEIKERTHDMAAVVKCPSCANKFSVSMKNLGKDEEPVEAPVEEPVVEEPPAEDADKKDDGEGAMESLAKPGLKTISKHFNRLEDAEKYQDGLHNEYDYVLLVGSPKLGEDGMYVWKVKKTGGVDEAWKGKLQDQYTGYEEFRHYSDTFGLAKRLGFKSARAAWDDNPTVTGSVNPKDYKKVPAEKKESELHEHLFGCAVCGHSFSVDPRMGEPTNCPRCEAVDIKPQPADEIVGPQIANEPDDPPSSESKETKPMQSAKKFHDEVGRLTEKDVPGQSTPDVLNVGDTKDMVNTPDPDKFNPEKEAEDTFGTGLEGDDIGHGQKNVDKGGADTDASSKIDYEGDDLWNDEPGDDPLKPEAAKPPVRRPVERPAAVASRRPSEIGLEAVMNGRDPAEVARRLLNEA